MQGFGFEGVEWREEREFRIDNLLVRIHFIIVMIRWTGLAPWEWREPAPGRRRGAPLSPRAAPTPVSSTGSAESLRVRSQELGAEISDSVRLGWELGVRFQPPRFFHKGLTTGGRMG